MAKGTGKDSRETFAIDRERFSNRDTNPDKATDQNTLDLFFKKERLNKINDQGVVSNLEDHGNSEGLLDDDHTQYFLLAGRAGGQIAYGGTGADNNLQLRSTSNATKGDVIINDSSDFLHGRYTRKFEVTAATTNNTLTTILTVPLTADRTYFFSAKAIVRRTNGADRSTLYKAATMYRSGAGAATRQGAITSLHDKSSSAVDIEFNGSGNNTVIQIKGVNTHNYNWVVFIEYAESN